MSFNWTTAPTRGCSWASVTRPCRLRVPASSSLSFFFWPASKTAQTAISRRMESGLFVLFFFVLVLVVILKIVQIVFVVVARGKLERRDAADVQARATLLANERIAFVEFLLIHVHSRGAQRAVHHSNPPATYFYHDRGTGWSSRLRRLGGAPEIGGRQRHHGLFQVLSGLDHVGQMQGGQLHAPRIGQGMAGFPAQREQIRMGQGDDLLLLGFSLGPQKILHIHSVGMADGDAGLKPAEFHFPGASEGIGSGAKAAGVVWHFSSVALGSSCAAFTG